MRTLRGIGGLRASGRWHRRGHEIVYLAENVAAAMLETLVHFDFPPGEAAEHFDLLEILVDDTASLDVLDEENLPDGWSGRIAHTQRIGDQWLASRRSLLLKVPSAVIPMSSNYLLNPLHPDARHVSIVAQSRHPFDLRLSGRGTWA